jgi:hypothetical protein
MIAGQFQMMRHSFQISSNPVAFPSILALTPLIAAIH